MVLIEDTINNWRVKVYGAEILNNDVIYYRVIEEPLFSEEGDCVLIVSNHAVSLDNRSLNPVEARSLIPVYRVRGQLVVHPTDEPVKYISFTLPRSLKDSMEGEELENQAGMVF